MRQYLILAIPTVVLCLGAEPASAEPMVNNAKTQEGTAAQGEPPSALGTFSIDPLGFLLFGPTVNAELGVGSWGLGGGFRWLSPGVLAKTLFLAPEDRFGFSYGVAARGHYYFAGGLRGAHAGLALEYLRTRVETDSLQIAALSSYVVPQVEGGYRLALGRFFVGGVLAVGYAAQLSSRIDSQNPDDADGFTVTDESSVYGSARLDLGVFF